VVAPFEEISDGLEIVFGGQPPNPRPDPPREDDRSDAGRTHPPPRGNAVTVARTGGTDRRAAADVRRNHRRRQHPRPEGPAGDEEVARSFHPPRDPHAERDLRRRVRDEDEKVAHRPRWYRK